MIAATPEGAPMSPQDRDRILEKMRQAVLDHAYVMTPHGELEMRKDRLDVVDVESAILTGRIEAVFSDDPRGWRYEVVGFACDLSTRVGVVIRFAGAMLIITVYEIDE
jgi:hypothetical protein